jgi:HSP20 family protein
MTSNFLFNVLNNPSHLQREVDRLLGATAFRGGCAAGENSAVSLGHDEDALYVEMAVPGVAPDAVEVTLEDDVLRIATKGPASAEDGKVTWHRRERAAGEKTHRLRIPVEVDRERISAVCKNGILTVTLPKAAAAKPKRIEVKVEK